MSELAAVAYVSTSSIPMDSKSVESMLEVFRSSNRAAGITGVLLYCNGSYMQYLEGPREAVNAIYRRVALDQRHHGVVELLNGPVEAREFGEWDMGYSEMGTKTFRELIERPWASHPSGSSSAIKSVLKTFWQSNTRARGALTSLQAAAA